MAGMNAVNALATPQQLVELERARRLREASVIASAGAEGMSVSGVLREAGEALVGIPRDVFGSTAAAVPLWFVFRGNRLRGVGAVLVGVGVAGLLLDALLE
jgi:hypothetical protein